MVSPTEPQSIIHQALRLRKKVGMSLPKPSLRRSHKSLTSVSTCTAANTFNTDDDDRSVGSLSVHDFEYPKFKTVDQNMIFQECFVEVTSDANFVFHLYNEESLIMCRLEEQLTNLIQDSPSNYKCRRINAKLAPLFTAKTDIDTGKSTVAVVKNGKIISHISLVSSEDFWELKEWMAETEKKVALADR